MKTSPKRYEKVDWERVRKALVVREAQLSLASGETRDDPAAGRLADQVITDFLVHPDGMDWDPKKGQLETFLRKLLDSRWIDRSDGQPTAELGPSPFFERIARTTADEPDLTELLEAVEMLDGAYGVVNHELAALIGTTVADVESRKQRLRSLLSGLAI